MKFTSAQIALLHAAESLGIGAIMTTLAALYQYFILHGFNVQGLVGVAVISFLGAFGMLYKSLTNNPNLGPAIADTLNELKSVSAQHTAAISSLQQQVVAPVIPAQPSLQFIQPQPLSNTTNLIPSSAAMPFDVTTLRHFGDTGIVPVPPLVAQ